MKNILIFASEFGSTKFIYNAILAQGNIRFTFVLSNDQDPSPYQDIRFINFEHFDLTTIKSFDLGIFSFNASEEDLTLRELFKANGIRFGSYIDSWINIEKKCANYLNRIEMVGGFLLVPTMDLCEFMSKSLLKQVKVYDVGHSDLEQWEEKEAFNTRQRSGTTIYSQPISEYFGNTIFNEHDLISSSINCLRKHDLKSEPINIILHPTEDKNKFGRSIDSSLDVKFFYSNELENTQTLPKLVTLLFTTRLINTYLEKTPTISLYNGQDYSNQKFLKNYSIFSNTLDKFEYNIKHYRQVFESTALKKISFLGSKNKFTKTLVKLLD